MGSLLFIAFFVSVIALLCQEYCERKMPRDILDADAIMPGRNGWTCVVQVIERHPVLLKELTTYPFQRRFRPYLLTDMKGTKVRAILFDRDIDFFQRSLLPFRRYKISNATVSLPPERYQLPGYRYSWIINNTCPVEPIADPQPHVLPCTFDVCRFSALCNFAESDTTVDIKGLVVHRFPFIDINETRSAKDYLIVNEEEIPIVLRLWKDLLADYDPDVNSFDKDPVTIIASNLEVKTFHGLSLATRNNTYIIENPPLPEDQNLKQWYANNKHKVTEWLESKAYEDTNKFFPPPTPDKIQNATAAMLAFQNVKTCWVKAKVKLNYTRASLCYVVCGNCSLTVNAAADWKLECSRCTVLSDLHARIKLPVTLWDDQTNIRSTISTPDAEKICPFSAAEIQNSEEEGQYIINDISIAMDNLEIVCFVKYYNKVINGEMTRRYVVLKTYTLDELQTFATNEGPEIPKDALLPSETTQIGSTSNPLTSAAPHEKAEAQKDFFTPTTKRVLEEIEEECGVGKDITSETSKAKRSIKFGTLTDEDLNTSSSKIPKTQATVSTEIPKKKNKAGSKYV